MVVMRDNFRGQQNNRYHPYSALVSIQPPPQAVTLPAIEDRDVLIKVEKARIRDELIYFNDKSSYTGREHLNDVKYESSRLLVVF